jgi:hypothetical protein
LKDVGAALDSFVKEFQSEKTENFLNFEKTLLQHFKEFFTKIP